jgi:hypothetical protein
MRNRNISRPTPTMTLRAIVTVRLSQDHLFHDTKGSLTIMSMSVIAVFIYVTYHRQREYEHTSLLQMMLLPDFPGLRSMMKPRLSTFAGRRDLL